jgi:putative transcription antitermination factor YqgF
MFDLLGIDWGSKLCGAAYGSSLSSLVIPYKEDIINNKDNEAIIKFIEEAIKEKNIKIVVVGLPFNMQLQNTQTTSQIENFIEDLKEAIKDIVVVTVNERGSSIAANKKIKSINSLTNSSTGKLINKSNSLAACEILTTYLKSK